MYRAGLSVYNQPFQSVEKVTIREEVGASDGRQFVQVSSATMLTVAALGSEVTCRPVNRADHVAQSRVRGCRWLLQGRGRVLPHLRRVWRVLPGASRVCIKIAVVGILPPVVPGFVGITPLSTPLLRLCARKRLLSSRNRPHGCPQAVPRPLVTVLWAQQGQLLPPSKAATSTWT